MFLRDREADAREESCDLVVLAGEDAEKDLVATWISSKCVPRFHKRLGHRIKAPRSLE